MEFQGLLIRQMDVLLHAPVDHLVSRPEDLVAAKCTEACERSGI